MKTAGCVCVCARSFWENRIIIYFLHTAFFDLLLKSGAGERLGRTSKRVGGLGRLLLKKGSGEEGGEAYLSSVENGRRGKARHGPMGL